MSSAREIVDQYFRAFTNKDLAAMRKLLHDDVYFKGPVAELDNADDFMEGITHLAANMSSAERHIVFEQGEDVCQIYDMVLAEPAVTVPVAQWLKVRDNKIAVLRAYSDARPLLPPE